MSDLELFDTLDNALQRAHDALAQSHLPTSQRSLTARNYDSSIQRLKAYLADIGEPLPTRSVLTRWRDDLFRDGLAVRTVNARLAAVRKLLRTVAEDSTDIQTKLVLSDWAKVADAKATIMQDKTEADYGRRLTLGSLGKLVNSIDLSTVKGLRDRALMAVMGGAGLRVSEAVSLTLRDVFLTANEAGQRGLKVRRGKHNKSRVVVLNSWNSWVIEAVQAYTDAIGLTPLEHHDAVVFRGVDRFGADTGQPLSERGGQRAVAAYEAEYGGEMIRINAHDLRRTYAKICKQSGMSWEGLRENMGHSSVKITEDYVGRDVDWTERMPNWTIKLKAHHS